MRAILISEALRLARVNEGSHSFTCHPDVYPHTEWAILYLFPSLRASSHFGRYSFSVPRRVGGWVGLGGWLHIKVVWPSEDRHHPGTNRARRRVTSLIIRPMPLPLRHATTQLLGLGHMTKMYSLPAPTWPVKLFLYPHQLSMPLNVVLWVYALHDLLISL